VIDHAYVAPGTAGVEAVWPVELAQTAAGAVMAGVTGQPTTLTAALSALLEVPASGVVVLTVAVFVIVVPLDGAVTSMVMAGAVVVAASAPIVQMTVLVPLQLQPVPETFVSVTPGGSVSVTLTSCVAPPAVLATVSV
jgi:hypothetical protein